MLRKIETPAKCELRSVIRFLHAEGSNAAEIHRRMSKVYGETFMSDRKVRKWCRNFDAGRTDVHDAGGQRRKPVSTDDLVQRVDQAIRGNRRFTISGLSNLFPEISRSILYTIVSERLEYRKLCARWALSFLMTMRGRTLQLQQRSSCSVLDGKFLITHPTVLTWLPQIFISLPA
ncbi:hypothetical protein AVEN_102938-1 [Araneus ventricosus]|uniref:Mos1 transposase HTH domain-containing protein n=1 Tax=Araneus ventricosus TaxID=182803 RepID=A0A4Y2TMW2_ARAVE|nr:hypothetical protein AVEN_102938-1 [Araneus ventricosus]